MVVRQFAGCIHRRLSVVAGTNETPKDSRNPEISKLKLSSNGSALFDRPAFRDWWAIAHVSRSTVSI